MGQPNLKGILPDKAVQVITQMATALTTLTTQFRSLAAKPLVTKPEADTAYGPATQVKALQVSGSNPLNVTGLIGKLSQPQLAGIPLLTSIPTSGPYSQPGTLIYVGDTLIIVTEPGTGLSTEDEALIRIGLLNSPVAKLIRQVSDLQIELALLRTGGGSQQKTGPVILTPNLIANIPSSAGLVPGTIFIATDTSEIWYVNPGGSWNQAISYFSYDPSTFVLKLLQYMSAPGTAIDAAGFSVSGVLGVSGTSGAITADGGIVTAI